MPRTYSDEEKELIWHDYKTVMTPEQKVKTEQLIGPPPPEQTPKPSSTSQDPRISSPWYQRLFQQYVTDPISKVFVDPAVGFTTETLPEAGRRAYERSAFGKKPWYDEPGYGSEKYVPTKQQTRTALEVGLPMLVAGAMAPFGGPAAIPVTTQAGRSALWNLAQQILPPAYRAVMTGVTGGVAAEVANKVDPERHIDPVGHGIATGTGEFFGGVGGNVYNRGAGAFSDKIVEHFGDTPQGATVRSTLESRGGEAALGTTTKNPFLESTSTFFEHVPGGRRLREIRTKGEQIIDTALQQYNRLFRGDNVSRTTSRSITRPTERSMLDLEAPLRPVLPGRRQTTLDAEARLRPNLAMGTQQDLEQVPREVARRVPEAIDQQQELTNRAFTNLKEVVGNSTVDARGFKSYIQSASAVPPGMQNPSLFHQLEDFKSSVAMLPDTITVDMAFDMQKRLFGLMKSVDKSIEESAALVNRGLPQTPQAAYVEKLLAPELGNTLKYTNKMLEGRSVDLRPIKEEARTILAGYEKGTQVGQGMMEGTGRTGRVPTPEDPHILVARNLLEKENFVPFDEAQQILSDFNALKRHPGVNIGNQPADAGERLRELLWGNAQKNLEGEIFKTTRNLDPRIETVFRNAQELYERGARLYNSPLMMDLSKASLDDILTKIVQNERPEDLKALRYVLGEDLFNRVGQMWLKRVENASTNTVTKVVSPVAVQGHLQELTPIAETELFPHGQVNRLKLQTDRTAAMEQGLTTNDPLVYRDLKKVMPRVDGQQVGEIRLSQMLEKQRDPVTGVIDFDAALREIQALKSTDMAQELWPAAQLTQIEESLRQASALKRALTTNDPLVLKELQRQAGSHWDTVGELRLSNIFRDATDAQGNLDIGKALDGIHAIRGEAEQVLYGNKLDPLKTALRKADAMEQVPKVLDKPDMITKYRQVINDPLAWQAVQRDVLGPGFKMIPRTPEMQGPAMIDGKALVDHINAIRQNPDVAKALFPDQRILDELHHLGETAMVLSKHGYEVPYAGRHYPFLVSFEPNGSPLLFGSKIVGAGIAITGGITQANRALTALLTSPRFVRLLTQGMHTPVTSPQASRIFGAMVGALESEGYTLEMSQPPPLPKVGD